MIQVEVRAGTGWPIVWKGQMVAIPAPGSEVVLPKDGPTFLVHRVVWELPARPSDPQEVTIYAK